MNTNPQRPWMQETLTIEDRINLIMSVLTLEEKVGQLEQIVYTKLEKATTDDLKRVKSGFVGSCILAESAWAGEGFAPPLDVDSINSIQRLAVESTPHGIPLIFGRDIIHGHNTVLPIPLAQAASFNPCLIQQASVCVAREARAQGVHWAFAPMLDLSRDPRWGRIIEGYGEDPYLISHCGAALIRGYQYGGASSGDRLLACAKHFCGYGGSEGGRDYDSTEWTDESLYNFVLPPFVDAIATGVASVMSGFNTIGGTPVSSSKKWIRRWLKERQGFAGCVVSDWGAVGDLLEHGVAHDGLEATLAGLEAGIDMEMVLEHYEENVPELLRQGRIDANLLDDAVRRVLRMKFKAGLFEQPYTDPELHKQVARRRDHVEVALRLAENSIVLLKNDQGLLPLDRTLAGMKVAVVGPYANLKKQHLGAWCLDGNPEDVTSILEGLRALCPDWDIISCDSGLSDDLLTLASQADVTILCVGESPSRSGEAHSIVSLELPPGQEDLIEAVGKLNKPLVLVHCSGRVLPSAATQMYAESWLQAWHLGTEAGHAIARVISGVVEPGGRLPVTVPRETGQIPIYYNRKRPGKLRQMDNYKSYLDCSAAPLFSFGFGLGYTDFDYSETVVEVIRDAKDNPELIVSSKVTNIGSRSGATVAQCYLFDPVAEIARPCKELKGFQRVALEPGESESLCFKLDSTSLGYYNENGDFRVDRGDFLVGIGPNSMIELTTLVTI